MARMGDEDEVGRGAAVAQLSDAARRRSERASDPGHDDVPPAPDPSAGIELITNVRADDHDAHVEALADDVLDETLARQPGAPDTALRTSPAREAPPVESATDPIDPGQDDHQHVREVLEHHHERRNPRELPTRTPRGSADLAVPVRRSSAQRERRPLVKAAGRTRARRRIAGSLAAAVTLAVIVAIVTAEAGSSAAKHHRTPAAVTQATIHDATSPTSLIALDVTHATAAIAAEGTIAASAHTAMEAEKKARAKARARARAQAAARARAARGRARQQTAERTHASSTAGSTGATTTEPVYSAPSSPTGSSSPSSTSASGGGSGSSSAPAGPTAIGSAGSNCNPKCS